MKAVNLKISDLLHWKIKAYADNRELPASGVMRLVLSDFFRNKHFDMKTGEELPEGVVDRGEGSGYVLDMEYFRGPDGKENVPPPDLTKEQTLAWIRKYHNGKKAQ